MKTKTVRKKTTTKPKLKPKAKPKVKSKAKPKTKARTKPKLKLSAKSFRGMGSMELTKPNVPKPNTHKPGGVDNNAMIATLAIGAVGVLGYLGFEFFHKKKMAQSHSGTTNTYIPASDTTDTQTNNPANDTTSHFKKKSSHGNETGTGEFPLKKGSKGEAVRKVQQAFLDKYGSSILPKYGADGDFGSEMARALKKLGLHTTISESAYNVILQGGQGGEGTNGSGNAKSDIAQSIYTAVEAGDFDGLLSHLKQIGGKEEYRQVSSSFKENYRVNGVHQTLVNATLDSFSDEGQKQQIRYEFLRMGLQYNGSKWSLSGVDGYTLITRYPTTIWVNSIEKTNVPANMVLGTEVAQKLDYTLFEHDNRYFLVQTAAVKRIQ